MKYATIAAILLTGCVNQYSAMRQKLNEDFKAKRITGAQYLAMSEDVDRGEAHDMAMHEQRMAQIRAGALVATAAINQSTAQMQLDQAAIEASRPRPVVVLPLQGYSSPVPTQYRVTNPNGYSGVYTVRPYPY